MCILRLDVKQGVALAMPNALKVFIDPKGTLAEAVKAGLAPGTKEPQVQQAIQAATTEVQHAKVSILMPCDGACLHLLRQIRTQAWMLGRGSREGGGREDERGVQLCMLSVLLRPQEADPPGSKNSGVRGAALQLRWPFGWNTLHLPSLSLLASTLPTCDPSLGTSSAAL